MASRRKFKERKLSVADAISEAFGEITALGEEMREVFDNMPENLQSSAKGEARGEVADTLENINEPDIPEVLQDAKFEITLHEPERTQKQQMRLSRASRRDDATSLLSAVVDYLNELSENTDYSEEVRTYAEELAQEVDSAKEEADGVEFPGMYG